ncbi:MAG: SH3 domain-containing protein, partial [Succiniclasticum sp.]|nr:SH3 domain-containing protein [Succiniclasticum sp.]
SSVKEEAYYGFSNSRVKVLEEKGDMSRIQSYKNGFTVWVPSRYLVDYKLAYGHEIEKVREDMKKRGTKSYSDFALREFPKESEMPKPDPAVVRTGVIAGTEVRMRKEGNMRGEVLGYFDKGEKVTILETKEGWHKVKRANNAVGWVSGQFCKEEFAR